MTPPLTCWVFPQPWHAGKPLLPAARSPARDRECPVLPLQHPQDRDAAGINNCKPADLPAECVETVLPDRREALLHLLNQDLARGYKYVAARHLMMLETQSMPIPPATRLRCELLLATCTKHRLMTIARQVEEWRRSVVCLNLAGVN